ncbi:nuclear transcription factor Y subunit gamma [Condylostylus longicornis]|uniref:nuclear transcription factor Y subunit gamma n=1 Tax=Condylostylus longicornis TaxID=2530218 RepID=UPI00244DCDDA|nr:nuclear transcription factor Y subunit gamma [Condylostylus longicornis]
MTTVIYNGSPSRHHSRMTSSHHLHHQAQQTIPPPSHYSPTSNQQHSNSKHPPTPSSVMSFNSHHQSSSLNPIIMPPASYLSTGTPMSSSSISLSQQQHQQQHSVSSHLPPTMQNHPPQYQQHIQGHYHHATLSMYPVGTGGRQHKRRSAVEMLAESKPLYVKSETVLDRHQHLMYRTAAAAAVHGSNTLGRESNTPGNAVACILSPVRTLGHHHHHHHHHTNNGINSSIVLERGTQVISSSQRSANRRSASSSSDLLQTKLRKLLNADTKDISVPELPRYKANTMGMPKKYDTFSKYQSVKYNQELSIHPSNDQTDSNVMFPSAFLSPQSLPPNPVSDDDIYSYGIDEPLILTEDYRAISPPAEYAAVDSSPEKDQRCNYQRSFSHSHEVASDDPDYSSPSYNINSHKSLPDLHSQISRHSPHSEVLSCCSRGNRSNKSGGGSSLNRDSGGSSGHYTHRSEPCCKQQRDMNKVYVGTEYRRDSGSSTQHSGNSYYGYAVSSTRYDCPECRSKYQKDSECLLNFTTPEVPEAFQDDYPGEQTAKATARYYEEKSKSRKNYIQSGKLNQSHQQQQHQQQQQQQQHHTQQQQHIQKPPTQQELKHHRHSSGSSQHHTQNSPTIRTPDGSIGSLNNEQPQIQLKPQELSPPLGTFKRQKCFRFKQRTRYSTSNDRNSCRTENAAIAVSSAAATMSASCEDDRKPILRSKSDISDRYWNRGSPISDSCSKLSTFGIDKRGRSESMSQLEKFFDRLGLNEEKYEEIYSPKRRFSSDNESDQSSTVFFSDVSTVDSTRLPDSTETQPQTQPYRPTEPPSIVERNARIIKWLCNCRKQALT